jgi:hypothetical protein
MSLRQFISSRAVVRALTAMRDGAAMSWNEAAALLGCAAISTPTRATACPPRR